MNANRRSNSSPIDAGLPNGSGAAALVAAGVGSIVLALLAIMADHISAIKNLMVFYKPTGPLSGVTTSAIVVWLVVWAILDTRWKRSDVSIKGVATVALVLLAIALVLMFPPVGDLF